MTNSNNSVKTVSKAIVKPVAKKTAPNKTTKPVVKKTAKMADLVPVKKEVAPIKTEGKLIDLKSVTDLVLNVEKNKTSLYLGKYKRSLLGFENDQRCETIALVASCIENDIIMNGNIASKIDSVGDKAIKNMVNSQFWGKWYEKHLARFNRFFQDGTTDKYVLSVIYHLVKDGHTFKHVA